MEVALALNRCPKLEEKAEKRRTLTLVKGCQEERKEQTVWGEKGEREVDDLDQTFISCQVVLWCLSGAVE